MHYVYVIQNEKGQLYTGCTSNLKKRLLEHNSGKSTFTSYRGPYELVYYEACLDSHDAYTREKYLKTGMGKRYLKNRLKTYWKEQDMNPVRNQSGIKSNTSAEAYAEFQPSVDNLMESGL